MHFGRLGVKIFKFVRKSWFSVCKVIFFLQCLNASVVYTNLKKTIKNWRVLFRFFYNIFFIMSWMRAQKPFNDESWYTARRWKKKQKKIKACWNVAFFLHHIFVPFPLVLAYSSSYFLFVLFSLVSKYTRRLFQALFAFIASIFNWFWLLSFFWDNIWSMSLSLCLRVFGCPRAC